MLLLLLCLLLAVLWLKPFHNSFANAYQITNGLNIVEMTLNVQYMWMTVGDNEKAVVAINNSKVGPTIYARHGDTLRILVLNNLYKEAITMHWHGIHMTDTPYMDGVPYITQCPIGAGQQMLYEFIVRQQGTFWYHTHVETTRDDACYGALILGHSSTNDIILFLSDFYSSDSDTQLLMLDSNPYRWVGSPKALLMNGEVTYNLTVTYGQQYRIHLISAAALSYYNFSIPNHILTIVEVEGSYIQEYNTPSIWINAGERYTFILNANNSGCYRIGFDMLQRNGPSGSANLIYDGEICTKWINGNVNTPFDINQLKSYNNENIANATRQLDITTQQIVAGGHSTYLLNNLSFIPPTVPLILSYYYGMPINGLTQIIPLNLGEVVDITFVNMAGIPNPDFSQQHPIHIHGHSCWVLGSGYKLTGIGTDLNTINPVRRDTFTLPNHGWITVRLVANNPGIWLLHCHVTWHMILGMSLVFAYPTATLPPPPQNFNLCQPVNTVVISRLQDQINILMIVIYAIVATFGVIAIIIGGIYIYKFIFYTRSGYEQMPLFQ
jgi:FtsP/CotA-like multicopper oxidase with cupredoxin domain